MILSIWTFGSIIFKKRILFTFYDIQTNGEIDQISIHIINPMYEMINGFKVYDNPFHVLKSNTPSPLSRHKWTNQGQLAQKNLSKFKLQEIPPYPHRIEHVPQRNMHWWRNLQNM